MDSDPACSPTASSSPPTPKDITPDCIAEARRQFSRMKKVDAWDLVKGFTRPGHKLLTTICHGELWEGNILMRKTTTDGVGVAGHAHNNNNQLPARVKLLDWKNAKISTSTLDLAFLMFSSATYKLRSESTAKILGLYHETYCRTLAELEPRQVTHIKHNKSLFTIVNKEEKLFIWHFF